jgi:cytochrome c553
VPHIAGQHAHVIAKQLLDYRYELRHDPRMEVVAGQHAGLSNQEIASVAAVAAGAPWPYRSGAGDGTHLDGAEARYQRLCIVCHGRAGAGSNAHVVPRLGGQDYHYLLRQLHDAIEARRQGMSVPHERLLQPLDAGELEGLADYLSRALPAPAAEDAPLTARRAR